MIWLPAAVCFSVVFARLRDKGWLLAAARCAGLVSVSQTSGGSGGRPGRLPNFNQKGVDGSRPPVHVSKYPCARCWISICPWYTSECVCVCVWRKTGSFTMIITPSTTLSPLLPQTLYFICLPFEIIFKFNEIHIFFKFKVPDACYE